MTDPGLFKEYSHPGLAVFGGILAGIMGTMNLIYGLLLLFNSEFLVLTNEGLLLWTRPRGVGCSWCSALCR